MISLVSPHVLRAHMGVHCACGEPNEIELTATRGLFDCSIRYELLLGDPGIGIINKTINATLVPFSVPTRVHADMRYAVSWTPPVSCASKGTHARV